MTTTTAPRASGRTLELFWDFSSPYAYLGTTQAEALAARTGATLVWQPIFLGGLFKTIGQVDAPVFSWPEAKRTYFFQDLERWAAFWNVPFRFPSRFPMPTIKALRLYLALPGDRRAAFRERTFHAYWAEDRDIADDGVLAEFAGPAWAEAKERSQSPEVKQALVDATARAATRGIFGFPTWIIDGKELFWGQDRMALVERALLG
jgi:2-hydroxychromene-2-carboxylate isomerase